MTYSIVAMDRTTGELGVGVQTHALETAWCPTVTAGVGAVATQADANVGFGPQIVSLLEDGLDAPRALEAVLAADSRPEVRQVAVIDARGRVAAHTGSRCVPFAAHVTGRGYSAQANMMLNDAVPQAMARAFESTSSDLADRLLAALFAAEAEGGDIRGRQSAAILVMGPDGVRPYYPWNLRVDGDSDPLVKLSRLVKMRRARGLLTRPEINKSIEIARRAFEAANAIAPSEEDTFWYAVQTLADTFGAMDEAASHLAPIFERAPRWKELLHRLPNLNQGRALLDRFPRGSISG